MADRESVEERPDQAPAGEIVNHVPGEVCLVVRDEKFKRRRFGDDAALERYAQAVYQTVLEQINRLLATLRLPVSVDQLATRQQAATADPLGRSPLEQDLTPAAGFREYFGLGQPDRAVFLPRAGDRDVVRPWLLLPRRSGATMLCFFAVGPADLRPADPTERERPEFRRYLARPEHQLRVRELVKLLNWRVLPQVDLAGLRGLSIAAATPNWLTCPMNSHGSPASLPERIAPVELTRYFAHGRKGRFTFRFVEPVAGGKAAPARAPARLTTEQQLIRQSVDTLVERLRLRPAGAADEPRVLVAVLDTSPTLAQVTERAAACRDNTLLNEVEDQATAGGAVTIHEDLLPAAAFAHLDGFTVNLKDRRGLEVSLADHGLFVAGIVRDIAPRARLRLIRVMNDRGIGDVAALFSILRRLPGELARGERLIVNLSLVADLPTADELLRTWFPATYADQAALQCSWKMIAALLNLTHLCLQEVLDWLYDQDVLVVAAAGNAAVDAASRPEPLFPAAYDSVLAVASVTRRDLPAMYSNRGDMRVFGNGVAVFGGEGIVTAAGRLPDIPEPGRDGWRDAVAGLFSAPAVPVAPGTWAKNETGWVWWSGTSFAAPVVAGLAANLLLDPPTSHLSVPALIKAIRAMATIPEFALEGSGPFDVSAIYARQVWQDAP